MSQSLPISTSNPSRIVYKPSLSSASALSSAAASAAAAAPQQPQTHPIAHFNSKPYPNPTSSLLDVNSNYTLYSVKNGLVRVMDRSPKSNLRTLLRGHSKRISDVSFFNKNQNHGTSLRLSNTTDVLGTVAGREYGNGDNGNGTDNDNDNNDAEDDAANVLIWRIYKREDELASEKLLEIRLKDAIRIVWHPFNPNQFVLLHNHKNARPGPSSLVDTVDMVDTVSPKEYHIVATFVETTRLMTIKHETENHAVCTCSEPDQIDGATTNTNNNNTNTNNTHTDAHANANNNNNNGGSLKLICFGPLSQVGIHDLCWSNQDTRHVITAHKNGTIKLWDLRDVVYLDLTTGLEVEGEVQGQGVGVGAKGTRQNLDHVIESAKCIMTLNVNDSDNDNTNDNQNVEKEVQRCMFLPSYDDASHTATGSSQSSSQSDTTNSVYSITSPFITVTKRGSCVTLWSPFTSNGQKPSIVRTFEFANDASTSTEYNVSLCTIPNAIPTKTTQEVGGGAAAASAAALFLPSTFVLFADKTDGNIYALHLHSLWSNVNNANATGAGTATNGNDNTDSNSNNAPVPTVNGFDYIIPFRATQPIYSWTTMVSPPSLDDHDHDTITPPSAGFVFDTTTGTTTNNTNMGMGMGMGIDGLDGEEEGRRRWNIDLFCVQSKSVQLLTLTNTMLTSPPSLSNSDDLIIEDLILTSNGHDDDDVNDDIGDIDITSNDVELSFVNENIGNDVELSFENEEYEVEEEEEDNNIEYDEYDDEDFGYEEGAQNNTDDGDDDDDNHNSDDDDDQDQVGTYGEKDEIPPPPMPNFFAGGNSESKPSSFSNWLGNLASVSASNASNTSANTHTNDNTNDNKNSKTSSRSTNDVEKNAAPVPTPIRTIPPTPQVTPQVTPASQPKPSIDLFNIPLPTVPDVELTDEPDEEEIIQQLEINATTLGEIPLEKPKPAQRYLSPIEILASAKKETKKIFATPAGAGAGAGTGANGKGPITILKSDKKESKKKSSLKGKNTQPVPIPSKDGRIAILKREDIVPKKASTDVKPSTVVTALTAPSVPSSTIGGVTKEEVEEIVRKAVSGHFQKQENVITAEIQKAVRYEVQSGLVPTLNKTVAQTLDQTISKTLKSTVAKSVKESTKINTSELATEIASKLQDPLVDSFYKSMRELMIPAFESGTREMFGQITSSIEKGLDLKQKDADTNAKAMEDMVKRMDAMAKTMEVLIQGVAKVTVGANVAPAPAMPAVPPPIETLKRKIGILMAAEDFEKAFTTAVSASNPDIAVWSCKNVDLSIVLESETPKLSQAIMLCLMQQLGADFSPQKDNDLKVKLAWLQSIALTLDPYNDNIKKHISNVCHQLITNLQAKITEPNVMLRREMQMLVQVIRGIGRT